MISYLMHMIVADGHTPYIRIDLRHDENKILLSLVKPTAVQMSLNLSKKYFQKRRITGRYLLGQTRLAGKLREIKIPLDSILMVYAKEAGLGWHIRKPE